MPDNDSLPEDLAEFVYSVTGCDIRTRYQYHCHLHFHFQAISRILQHFFLFLNDTQNISINNFISIRNSFTRKKSIDSLMGFDLRLTTHKVCIYTTVL